MDYHPPRLHYLECTPPHYEGVLHHLQGSPKHVSELQPWLTCSFLVVPTLPAILSGPPTSHACPLWCSPRHRPLSSSPPLASLGYLRSPVRGRLFIVSLAILSAGQGWTPIRKSVASQA